MVVLQHIRQPFFFVYKIHIANNVGCLPPILGGCSTNMYTWIPCLNYFNREAFFLRCGVHPCIHVKLDHSIQVHQTQLVYCVLMNNVLVISLISIHKATTLVSIHSHHMLSSLYHLIWATHSRVRAIFHRCLFGGYVGLCVLNVCLVRLSSHVLALSCIFGNKP